MPAGVEVAVEPGDEEDDVDVGGDDLFLGGVAGRAPREAAVPRQHGDGYARRRRAAARSTRDPVADRREIGARRRLDGAAGPDTRASALARRRSCTR